MATIEGKIIAELTAEPTDEIRIITPSHLPTVYDGDTTILCGACGAAMWSQSALVQIKNMVIKCPKCGKFNLIDL